MKKFKEINSWNQDINFYLKEDSDEDDSMSEQDMIIENKEDEDDELEQ